MEAMISVDTRYKKLRYNAKVQLPKEQGRKQLHLGTFDTRDEAIEAVRKWRKRARLSR